MLNSLHIQKGTKSPAYLLAGGVCACVCASLLLHPQTGFAYSIFTPHLTFPFHPYPCLDPLMPKDLGNSLTLNFTLWILWLQAKTKITVDTHHRHMCVCGCVTQGQASAILAVSDGDS